MYEQSWSPAPKKRIIPLHPMTFGMLLGRAFSALRHNPKVLFGFAVVLQLVVVLVTAGVMTGSLFATFLRIDSLSPSSPDYEAVVAGAVGINIAVGILIGLASTAFTAIMQGIVAANMGYAALGEKPTLRRLWRRMRPAFWRLTGYSALVVVIVFGIIALAVAAVLGAMAGGLTDTGSGIAVIVAAVVLFILACIPLYAWLSTKLLLVPSILVLENARLKDALLRSWRLTRGRFWVAFGVMFLISSIMGVATQVVSIPVSLFSSVFGSVIMPTGPSEDDPASIIGFVLTLLIPQTLLLVLQAIALVVQCTGSAVIYLDSRMRYEGLDQTLISHVERRERGATEEELPDPFAVDPERAVSSAPPPAQTPDYAIGAAYGSPAPGVAYPQGGPAAAGWQAQPPGYLPPQPAAAPAYSAPPAPPAPPVPSEAGQPLPGSPSPWSPPGSA